MRLMAHRDNMHYQCYMLNGSIQDALMWTSCHLRLGLLYPHTNEVVGDRTVQYHQRFLQNPAFYGFVLLQNSSDPVVGISQLEVLEDTRVAHFELSHIDQEKRGFGLADLLYQARFHCLDELGFRGDVFVDILKNNEYSMDAAYRHGFSNHGHESDDGSDGQKLSLYFDGYQSLQHYYQPRLGWEPL